MSRTSIKSPAISIAPCDIYESVGSVTLQGGTVETGEVALLGTQVSTGDGRAFAWSQPTAALVVGKVYQSPPQDTTNYQDLSVVAAAIGDVTVTTSTTTTVALNALTDAYMVVRSGTGAGQTYVVASNVAASGTALTVTLADPLRVALNTTSIVDFTPNPYYNVLLNPATATGAPVGVAVYAVPAAAQGWLQVNGPAAVLAATDIVVGDEVAMSTGTAGAVVPASGSDNAVIGTALQAFTAGNYGLVNLNIN